MSRESAKTVFITGCSSGIGRSCAVRFSNAGFNVIATARRLETIHDLEKLNSQSGGEVRITTCDVTSEESRQAAVDFARETFGSIDILVNNAGFGLFGPIEMLPMEEARYQMEVNVFGPMRMVQLVIDDMRKREWGRIINVSSVAGRMYVPMGGWYSASKHAVEALTDALRFELGAFGIDVVSIMPGPVETEFVSNVRTPIRDREDAPAVYRKIGKTLRERNDTHRHGSVSADRVAEIVLKAATLQKPKTRYTITAQDRLGLCMKKILSDRMWDNMIISFYKLAEALKQKKEKSTV